MEKKVKRFVTADSAVFSWRVRSVSRKGQEGRARIMHPMRAPRQIHRPPGWWIVGRLRNEQECPVIYTALLHRFVLSTPTGALSCHQPAGYPWIS